MCVRAQSCLTPCDRIDCVTLWIVTPIRLLCQWNFPDKDTGVGCHVLLQGIFPTQGLSLCLLHWQANSLPLSHLGSPGKKNGVSNVTCKAEAETQI